MKVRAYGNLTDMLGQETEFDLDLPCTVAELLANLATKYPDAAEKLASKRVLACVGDTIVANSYVIQPGTHVDLLAPVSGG